ncbi:MAG: TatD family hydrolase [Parvularculaceae bacterium]|nr:TatD family hydrolase [Parvularculaceae bacterium]
MLIDSHVNLHHEQFATDLDAVIERARAAGVRAMLTISDKLESTPAISAIAGRHRFLWRTIGVHPHYAKDHADLDAQTLVDLAQDAKVVGVGECGIDHYYEHSPRDQQEAVFRAHIGAARATRLPLVIHTRDADATTQSILEDEQARGAFTPLLHCYTGGLALAEAVVAMGGFVSFSGILTFKNAADLRAIAAALPLERILVETDCPYLAPVPHRGRRAEPAHVVEVARALAAIRGLTFEAVAAATTDAFFRCFSRAKREDAA